MATATATATRRSRKAQDDAQQPKTEPQAQSTADEKTSQTAEQPKPEGQPEAIIEVAPVPVTYYQPRVTLPNGQVITCEHKYLHEHEKAAQACGRRMASLGYFMK